MASGALASTAAVTEDGQFRGLTLFEGEGRRCIYAGEPQPSGYGGVRQDTACFSDRRLASLQETET